MLRSLFASSGFGGRGNLGWIPVSTGLLAVYSGASMAFHFRFVLVNYFPVYTVPTAVHMFFVETTTWSVLICKTKLSVFFRVQLTYNVQRTFPVWLVVTHLALQTLACIEY